MGVGQQLPNLLQNHVALQNQGHHINHGPNINNQHHDFNHNNPGVLENEHDGYHTPVIQQGPQENPGNLTGQGAGGQDWGQSLGHRGKVSPIQYNAQHTGINQGNDSIKGDYSRKKAFSQGGRPYHPEEYNQKRRKYNSVLTSGIPAQGSTNPSGAGSATGHHRTGLPRRVQVRNPNSDDDIEVPVTRHGNRNSGLIGTRAAPVQNPLKARNKTNSNTRGGTDPTLADLPDVSSVNFLTWMAFAFSRPMITGIFLLGISLFAIGLKIWWREQHELWFSMSFVV